MASYARSLRSADSENLFADQPIEIESPSLDGFCLTGERASKDSPGLKATLDEQGNILSISGEWRSLLFRNIDSPTPIGLPFRSLKMVAPVADEAERYFNGLQRVVEGGAKEFHCFYRSESGDDERWFKADAFCSRFSGTLVSLQDVGALHLTKGVVEEMYLRLSAAKEEERRRIAVELHDSTSQHLAAIGLHIMTLRQRSTSHQDVSSILDDIERSLDIVQKEVRSTNYLLFPFDLERAGLSAALHALANGFKSRAGLQVAVQLDRRTDALPFPMQKALFRIVQEALSNARRHARATMTSVHVAVKRNVVVCRIADDGVGIRRKRSPSPAGVGIPGMTARARQFGGVVRIRTGVRIGTTVCALIPLAGKAADTGKRPLVKGVTTTEIGFPMI